MIWDKGVRPMDFILSHSREEKAYCVKSFWEVKNASWIDIRESKAAI
jgi:hypothetical protein